MFFHHEIQLVLTESLNKTLVKFTPKQQKRNQAETVKSMQPRNIKLDITSINRVKKNRGSGKRMKIKRDEGVINSQYIVQVLERKVLHSEDYEGYEDGEGG